MNDGSKKYTVLELLCVFFWFLMDGFWLLEWKIPTYAFSILAIVMAAMMFFCIRRDRAVILIACADTSWLLCNICWATSDLSDISHLLTLAKVFFGLGLTFCILAFTVSDAGNRLSTLVLSRMRIMKYFEKGQP